MRLTRSGSCPLTNEFICGVSALSAVYLNEVSLGDSQVAKTSIVVSNIRLVHVPLKGQARSLTKKRILPCSVNQHSNKNPNIKLRPWRIRREFPGSGMPWHQRLRGTSLPLLSPTNPLVGLRFRLQGV